MFEGTSSREYFESVLASQGINPPISYHARSLESVRSAVANGLGFSLAVVNRGRTLDNRPDNIVVIPAAERIDPLAIVLLRKPGAPRSEQIDRFSEFCKLVFDTN